MNLKDHKLSQTAARIWCLLRVFPYLVSDKVEENDEYLELIILLNRICEVVFAPKLPESIIPYFAALIEDHEKLFRKLFPHINSIHKLHHMSHYPDYIAHSGPLRWLNCFRFEARHGLLKKHGGVCCNYKNITKTLANVTQITQCSIWATGQKPRDRLKYPNGERTKVRDTRSRGELNQMGLEDDCLVTIMQRIEVYSIDCIEYRIGLFVAIDSGRESKIHDVSFGCIDEILLLESEEVYLRCNEWPSLWLSESLNAHCVSEGLGQRFLNVNELCDLKPFSISRVEI